MARPVPAQKASYRLEAKADRTSCRRACGRSRKRPFHDGTHKTLT